MPACANSLCVCVTREGDGGNVCHIIHADCPLYHLSCGALHDCRHLCLLVEPRCVYCTLAGILGEEGDLQFASTMVQQLNLILFTSAELFEMRMQLKDLSTEVGPLTHARKKWLMRQVMHAHVCGMHRRTGGSLDCCTAVGATMQRLPLHSAY